MQYNSDLRHGLEFDCDLEALVQDFSYTCTSMNFEIIYTIY